MTDEERASNQQALAAAIRRYLASGPETAATLLEASRSAAKRTPYTIACFAGLAAAAVDDATWDALAQVRQTHVLTRTPCEHKHIRTTQSTNTTTCVDCGAAVDVEAWHRRWGNA